MRPLGALPIRTQLLLMAALVAAPMFGLLTWSGLHLREEAMDRARVQAQRLADTLAAEHETVVAGAQQLLVALAHLPAIRERAPGAGALLAEVARHNPHLLNVFAADRDGKVWAWASGAGGASVADRRYFSQALSTGRLSSGEYAVSRSTGRPTLHFGLPYRDPSGRVAGVIAVALALETYRAVLERSPLPAGSSYLLLDHRGTIMARATEQERYQGRPFIPERFAAMVAGPDQGTDVGLTMVGDERVVSWRKLRLQGEPEPYLYVRVGLPVAAVLAGANADLARNLALALALLAPSMALVAWAGKRWLVDRLRALEAASARMADGDLSIR
ncbi:MAG: cache domain-containing protein, partial [Anaeromyxobacteraceae bacterium]|nr:cache domain-containing protein [Anaeromyxobacteraceae bacterium]